MNQSISIIEKYSRHWPLITYISISLSVLFFSAYLLSNGVLLTGYLRLFAFVFFAAGVFGLFKMKDGRVRIEVESESNGSVVSRFYRGDELLLEESWNLRELHDAEITEMPNKNFYYDLVKSAKAVRVRGEKDDSWLYFNKLSNRVVPLDNEQAEALCSFLEKLHSDH